MWATLFYPQWKQDKVEYVVCVCVLCEIQFPYTKQIQGIFPHGICLPWKVPLGDKTF